MRPAVSKSKPRIAIVGAGFAGLACAWQLRQAGIACALFEGRNRIGGRVLSNTHLCGPGSPVELGGEFIDSSHRDARERDVQDSLEQFAARISKDVQACRTSPEACARFDRLTLAEYMSAVGVSGWFWHFLDATYAAEFGLAAHEQSAMNIHGPKTARVAGQPPVSQRDGRAGAQSGPNAVAHRCRVACAVADRPVRYGQLRVLLAGPMNHDPRHRRGANRSHSVRW